MVEYDLEKVEEGIKYTKYEMKKEILDEKIIQYDDMINKENELLSDKEAIKEQIKELEEKESDIINALFAIGKAKKEFRLVSEEVIEGEFPIEVEVEETEEE